MAEIVARFADGRLLVQEDRAVQTDTTSGGYATLRIGHVKTVERVLSIDAQVSGYRDQKVATEIRDVLISGDTLIVQLRRCDLGLPVLTGTVSGKLVSGLVLSGDWGLSGLILSGSITVAGPIGSGTAALNQLSGITSGRGYYEPLLSGVSVSGVLQIMANVIGF